MPGRGLSLTIIAFWLGTTAWLLWRDVWPNWRPNEPPPYTIDLIEEVNTDPRYKPRVRWVVFQNDREVFRAETWVERPQSEVFELKALLRPPSGVDPQPPVVIGPARVLVRQYLEGADPGAPPTGGLHSTYRVTQGGRLLGIEGKVEIDKVGLNAALPGVPAAEMRVDVTAHFAGEVREGQFFSAVRLRSPLLGQELERDLKTVPVSTEGSVLLPLHPVNRIQGLRPGQGWRMPVLNPVQAAATATLKEQLGLQVDLGDSTRYLRCRVLPERQTLPEPPPVEPPRRFRYVGAPCLVIESADEEMTAHTWVEEETGLVLRQEVQGEGQHWIMQRE
jgi:hypothetical protein